MMNKALKNKNLNCIMLVVFTSICSYALPPVGVQTPPPPTPPPGFPIDKGIVLLIVAAIVFGFYKLKKHRYQTK